MSLKTNLAATDCKKHRAANSDCPIEILGTTDSIGVGSSTCVGLRRKFDSHQMGKLLSAVRQNRRLSHRQAPAFAPPHTAEE